MIGAIIGDIVGSAYEFSPTNDYDFELFPANAGFTDDTVCTVAIADALLYDKPFCHTLHQWCRSYPHPKGGYGGRFRQWVNSDTPEPYGSYGNGSAMRVSPVAWWCECDLPLTDLLATRSAACTHNHPDGIRGAMATARAIVYGRAVREGAATLQEAMTAVLNEFYPDLMARGICLDTYRNRFDETCNGTVPPALYIVMASRSFEDALRRAVSLGADADTLGAIVGSIAEAVWGVPEWMKCKAMEYLPEKMRRIVTHPEWQRRRAIGTSAYQLERVLFEITKNLK